MKKRWSWAKWWGRAGKASQPPSIWALSPQEAGACHQLHQKSFAYGWSADDFEALLSSETVCAEGIWRGASHLVGYVLSRIVKDEADLLTLVIAEKEQRKGLGTTLLTHHLAHLKAQGVRFLFLEVEENNKAAQALYKKYPYQEVGRRPHYYLQKDAPPTHALVFRIGL